MSSPAQGSKTSILQPSAFFTVQLSHLYMTTGKTIALTRRTFVDKVMSRLLNMLSRLVVTFLSRSERLLISWLQSPSTLILEPPKIKSDAVSSFSLSAAAAKSLQLCPTLCDPIDGSPPGFSVIHHLPEFAQTHAHLFSDAIQLNDFLCSHFNMKDERKKATFSAWENSGNSVRLYF